MLVQPSTHILASIALFCTLATACADYETDPDDTASFDSSAGPVIQGDGALPAWDGASPLPMGEAGVGSWVPPTLVDAGVASSVDSGLDAGPTTDAGTGAGGCCPDGNCLCHGPAPSALSSASGPFKTAQLMLSRGSVTYPTDAEPPFASVAVCGGFTNTGPEMASWAPFYASHGIVTIITSTGAADDPNLRGDKLLAALEQLKEENTKNGSPLFGKLDTARVGTSGYSMGGGGTTIASTKNMGLRSSVGLAAWMPATSAVTVPTLLLCGSNDTTAPCSQSQGAYNGIAGATHKMLVNISGATHRSWYGPTDAGNGASGKYALAFQKVYLEGDTRWQPLLKGMLSGTTVTTNIQ